MKSVFYFPPQTTQVTQSKPMSESDFKDLCADENSHLLDLATSCSEPEANGATNQNLRKGPTNRQDMDLVIVGSIFLIILCISVVSIVISDSFLVLFGTSIFHLFLMSMVKG